jgi:hypothetical protein
MKLSIRQLATAAIVLSLLMNGKPSHGEAEASIPEYHVGVIVPQGFPAVKFWIWAEHIQKWVPHVAEAKKGMLSVKCDYIPGNGPCAISFDEGQSTWALEQTVRYKIGWNANARQYFPEELPLR